MQSFSTKLNYFSGKTYCLHVRHFTVLLFFIFIEVTHAETSKMALIWNTLGPGGHSDPDQSARQSCAYLAQNPDTAVVGFEEIKQVGFDDPPAFNYRCYGLRDDGEKFLFNWYGLRGGYKCTNGSIVLNHADRTCQLPDNRWRRSKPPRCPNPSGGNPIALLTGEKTQIEIDFEGTSVGTLPIRRWYTNRGEHYDDLLGFNVWRLEPYSISLSSNYNPATGNVISSSSDCGGATWSFYSGSWWGNVGCQNTTGSYIGPAVEISLWNGKRELFLLEGTLWKSESDAAALLKERWDSGVFIGWQYKDIEDNKYLFNTGGVVQEIHSRDGATETVHYDISLAESGDSNPTTIDRVEDNLGRSLTFTNIDGKISVITGVSGELYAYSYSSENLLNRVVYPDEDNNPSNNPVRQYHYNDDSENPTSYWHLTGITDERGVRYANWSYQSRRAISSNHGEQRSLIDLASIDYNNIPSETAPSGHIEIANALGKVATYHFTTQHNARRLTHIEGNPRSHPTDSSISCMSSERYYTYDSNGFKDKTLDMEGNVIDYDFDTRGLEVRREEGRTGYPNTNAIPPQITLDPIGPNDVPREITTVWNTKHRLPARVTKMDSVTDYMYDCDNGRLESEQVYALGSEPTSPPDCS